VKIESQNESRAAVGGLEAGATVALVDPTIPRKAAPGSTSGGLGGTP